MCRWMAYLGEPIDIEKVLYNPQHSIVRQSLEARMGAEPTNGDGFGLGWYTPGYVEPTRYRTTAPAWNEPNLKEITRYLVSHCFLFHVRAAIGSTVQLSNCHPFRHKRWMFCHNGYIDGWPGVRRELMVALDDELFGEVDGSTDSEVLFMLLLTHGLEHDPSAAIAETVERVESACRRAGADDGIQMTIAATDGDSIHAARYATRGAPRSLYSSSDIATLQDMYPDNPGVQRLDQSARFIVSEPFVDLPNAFHEIPPGTLATATREGYNETPFTTAALAGA